MLQNSSLGIVGNQVIIFIIPCQKPWTYLVKSAVLAQLHLFMHIPVKILETNLHIAGYCSINHIYTVVNGFIDRFVAVNDYDLTLQFSGIVIADKLIAFLRDSVGIAKQN